MTSEVV